MVAFFWPGPSRAPRSVELACELLRIERQLVAMVHVFFEGHDLPTGNLLVPARRQQAAKALVRARNSAERLHRLHAVGAGHLLAGGIRVDPYLRQQLCPGNGTGKGSRERHSTGRSGGRGMAGPQGGGVTF